MRNMVGRGMKLAAVALAAAMLFGVFGSAVLPAHADPGAPFNPGDNRINPMTGDNVAVYCNTDNVQIYGLDYALNGFYLTTFTLPELVGGKAVTHQTASGPVSLKQTGKSQSHWGYASGDTSSYGLIVDVGAQYTANFAGVDKSFSCTYDAK